MPPKSKRGRKKPVAAPNLSTEEEEATWNSIQENSYDEITHDQVAQCYHYDEPVCTKQMHKSNCKTNPRCYHKLGEKVEGIWDKSAAVKALGYDPRQRMREENSIVGLRNLGATCYMNSLFQCLFMNPVFRRGIFIWNEKENASSDVIKHLQLLFAKLQLGNKKYVSPKMICQVLNLRTGVQQDVQEFNKLFLAHLDEQFATSRNPELKTLLSSQFCGKQSYVTKCGTCGNVSRRYCSFNELELQIKDFSTLEDCLKDYIKVEELKGDNQYECSKCNKRQDASRSISLLQLPQVLTIQLMRFIYDMTTFTKKKLRTVVSFPKVIDFGKYLDPEERKEQIYELTAVLMHSGPSAYGGHYTAQIRDETTNRWWRYDDEKVTEITRDTQLDEHDPGAESDTDEPKKKGRKKKKVEPQKNTDRFSSSNAYTLVYTLKGRAIPVEIKPSDEIQKIILAKNEKFKEKTKTFEEKLTEIERRYEEHVRNYEQLISIISPSITDSFNWISTASLSNWVKGNNNSPIDNSALICQHNKVGTENLPNMKMVSKKAWEMLSKVGGGPLLTNDDICIDCVKLTFKDMVQKNKVEAVKQHIVQLISHPPEDSGFVVSKAWLKSWKKNYLKVVENSNENPEQEIADNITEDITCPHGQLAPVVHQKLATISSVAWKRLSHLYPKSKPFPSGTTPCIECTSSDQEQNKTRQKRKQEREHEKRNLNRLHKAYMQNKDLSSPLADGTYYCIPDEWLDSWTDYLEDYDIDKCAPISSAALLCPHEQLKYHPLQPQKDFYLALESEHKILKELYGTEGPEIVFITVDGVIVEVKPSICDDCRAAREKQERVDSLNYKGVKIQVVLADEPTKDPGDRRRYKLRSARTSSAEIKVDSTDTIHTLKLKVMEQLDIPPLRQKLIYNGAHLNIDESTLAACEIVPRSKIQVAILESKDEKDCDFIERHQSEEGFKGTNLQSSSIPADINSKWLCECGYENTGVDSICSLCGRHQSLAISHSNGHTNENNAADEGSSTKPAERANGHSQQPDSATTTLAVKPDDVQMETATTPTKRLSSPKKEQPQRKRRKVPGVRGMNMDDDDLFEENDNDRDDHDWRK